MSAALVELYKHNLWANLRLLDICERLDDRQLNASAQGTYGRVRDTLLHMLGSEERYVKRIMGKGPEPHRISEQDDLPGFEALEAGARWSGEALIEIAAKARPSRVLRGVWRGQPYEIPIMVVLTQAINHATEHRAHISTILTLQGIAPPDLSGWAYGAAMAATKKR